MVREACRCATCRRLVAGTDGDVKVCVVDGEANLVLCTECFWRDARRDGWLEWRIEPSDPCIAACGRVVDSIPDERQVGARPRDRDTIESLLPLPAPGRPSGWGRG